MPLSAQGLPLTASAANLRRLALIRLIATTVMAGIIVYAYFQPAISLNFPVHLSLLASYTLLNVFTYWRLQQRWPVTDLEYFIQLLLDIAIISGLLLVSGGASNPFVSYYLVPLTISAALLPWRYTWAIAGLSLTAYSAMLWLESTGNPHSAHGGSFIQHILGMWVTFAGSAVLITYFVVKMATTVREQQARLADARETELLNEQVLAVATLAAGTAHELGTPLSTMAVLLDEIRSDANNPTALNDDLTLLQRQVDHCREILKGLVATAENRRAGELHTVAVDHYLQQLLDHWQVLRPKAQYNLTVLSSGEAPSMAVDSTLEQAIANLLNNAADACDQPIDIQLSWQGGDIVLSIRDYGPGIALDVAEQIGKPFVSSKHQGLGLGLFLSHASVARLGGSIALFNHPEQGTLAELRLPIIAHNHLT